MVVGYIDEGDTELLVQPLDLELQFLDSCLSRALSGSSINKTRPENDRPCKRHPLLLAA
jgi:hypothetical protein